MTTSVMTPKLTARFLYKYKTGVKEKQDRETKNVLLQLKSLDVVATILCSS